MEKMKQNFKQLSIFQIIALIGAFLMIVGTFLPYVHIEEALEYNLIKAFPIGGIIIIILSLLVIIGIGISNRVLSVVGSALAMVGDIVFFYVIRTESFYYKLTGQGDLEKAAKETTDALGDMFGSDLSGAVSDSIKSLFEIKVGFYFILIAALIALVAIVIDMLKLNKNVDTSKLNEKASGVINSINNTADHIIANNRIKSTPWICEECNKENDAKSKFCVYCGAAKPRPKTCHNCGTHLEEHMKFCPKCGMEYDKEKSKAKFDEILENEGILVCKKCGAELPKDATFCGKCGTRQ